MAHCKGKVTVVGGGNAAHVMMCELTRNGYEVVVFAPFKDEAERLNDVLDKHGRMMKINYVKENKAEVVRIGKVSKEAAEVVPGSRFVMIPLPVFAQEDMMRNVIPHMDPGAYVVALPATGGFDWMAMKVMKELGKTVKAIGVAPMPYVCRYESFGKEVNLYGIKAKTGVASLPADAVNDVGAEIGEMLHLQAETFPSFAPIALAPTNPIMHPGRMYGMLVAGGNWRERNGFPAMVKFYDDCDDVSNEWLHKLDGENLKIVEALEKVVPGSCGGKVLPINLYLKWVYGDDMAKWDTCKDCYQTNVPYKGLGSPLIEVAPGYWVPDFKNRYFTEDIPYGLLANKGIGQLLGVPTPYMDTVIRWAQYEMKRHWINPDGTINTTDKNQMTPQLYGLTLDDLKTMWGNQKRPNSPRSPKL